MMSGMIDGPPPEPPLPAAPEDRGRRLTPWQWAMLAIAGVIVVVLAAIVVWPDSGDDVVTVDTTTAPTTTAAQVVTVPSTPPPTTAPPPTEPPPTTPAPTTAPPTTQPVFQIPALAVAVTLDGRLVVLDTSSGQAVEARELDRGPDPRVEVEEGTPAYLGASSLTPDGATVYYHFCCEPVVGDLFRVPVDGSAEPERLGFGSDPAVSRQGDRLAYIAYDAIVVRDLASGAEAPFPDADHAGTMVDVTWTADGAALLYVRGAELVRLDLTNGQAQVIHTGQGYLAHPLDLDGTITVVDQCCYDDDTPFSLEQASLVTVSGGTTSLPQPVFDRQLSPGGIEVRAYQDGSLVWFSEDRQASLGAGYSAADW
jgi:hypothetical protein